MLTFRLILELNNNWQEYKKNKKYEVREMMGKIVKHVINSFSWRKHIIEYTGKDPKM